MLDINNQFQSLDFLCLTNADNSKPIKLPTNDERVRAVIVISADAYCEARGEGLTGRQAEERATKAFTNMMINKNLEVENLPDNFLELESESRKRLCPELLPTGRYD